MLLAPPSKICQFEGNCAETFQEVQVPEPVPDHVAVEDENT